MNKGLLFSAVVLLITPAPSFAQRPATPGNGSAVAAAALLSIVSRPVNGVVVDFRLPNMAASDAPAWTTRLRQELPAAVPLNAASDVRVVFLKIEFGSPQERTATVRLVLEYPEPGPTGDPSKGASIFELKLARAANGWSVQEKRLIGQS